MTHLKNLRASFSVLMLLLPFMSTSQPLDWAAFNKYWGYRNRLVNDFLVRGLGPPSCDQPNGYSLPAEATFINNADIQWSDATVDLGWYMGVLATEYQLLTAAGRPTESTLVELFYAMKAFERLDRKAERLFYPQNGYVNCSDYYLNGLFVRDDVGENSFLENNRFRDRYTVDGVFKVESDYKNSNNGVLKKNVYPSQDQIAHLFMGFALVKKCLGSATYQGYNFRTNAMLFADKIASRLEGNDWVGRLENGEVYEHGNTFLDEFTALGVARAAEKITGQSYLLEIDEPNITGWNMYADLIYGEDIMDIINFYNHVDFTSALIQSYAAVGSSWEYGIVPVKTILPVPVLSVCFEFGIIAYPCLIEIPVEMWSYQLNVPLVDVPLGWHPFELPDLVVNVTSERLAHYGTNYSQQIFSLLHEYLHSESSTISNTTFIDMINSAPCNGPHHKPYYDQNDVGVNGWRAGNRFCRPLNADGWNDYDTTYTYGEFNGLDYMLLHNLYLLSRNSGGIPFKNRLNQVSSETLIHPGNHWSYETLEFNGTIEANPQTIISPVQLSSGKSVTLKPGFHSEPGSTMRAYTSNYNACNTTVQQSSALRVDESKSADRPRVDTLAIEQAIANSLQQKISSQVDAAVASLSAGSPYTPLAVYLEKRAQEDQVEAEVENIVTLFPNPSGGQLRVSITLHRTQSVRLQLRDINGKYVSTLHDGHLQKGFNQINADVNHLPEGTFLVEVQGEFFSDYQRFIKTNDK